jgi:integrase
VRFWYVDGVLGMSLVEVVPKVVNRRAALQQALQPAQVRALLASCDLRRPAGRRDFAVLMLLARMGLRSGEVAGLQLADIATVSDGSARRHRTPHDGAGVGVVRSSAVQAHPDLLPAVGWQLEAVMYQ